MEHKEKWEAAVGEAIRAERAARKMSQAEVARLSGIPRQTYIRYEVGERQPNVTQVAAIAMALGMPVSQLVAEIARRASL
ncbi:MAG TPA: helix-turn-helix transcriptional regulator [Cellulomonas sp.]